MLKYGKPVRKKPDALISTLASFVQVAVMLVGIIGLSVHLFNDQGWLKQFVNGLMEAKASHLAVALPLLLLTGYLLNRWLSAAGDGRQGKLGDLMMYLMMAIGVFFIYKLVAQGGF